MKKRACKMLPKGLKMIVYDFDGVLTDNKVFLDADGRERVAVNRSDGMAIRMMREMGIRQMIMTSEAGDIAGARARKLGILSMNNVKDKRSVLLDYCRKNKIPPALVAYAGNDINDIEAMRSVGCAVCPSDAHKSVRAVSDIVLVSAGGSGVARELMDLVKI